MPMCSTAVCPTKITRNHQTQRCGSQNDCFFELQHVQKLKDTMLGCKRQQQPMDGVCDGIEDRIIVNTRGCSVLDKVFYCQVRPYMCNHLGRKALFHITIGRQMMTSLIFSLILTKWGKSQTMIKWNLTSKSILLFRSIQKKSIPSPYPRNHRRDNATILHISLSRVDIINSIQFIPILLLPSNPSSGDQPINIHYYVPVRQMNYQPFWHPQS